MKIHHQGLGLSTVLPSTRDLAVGDKRVMKVRVDENALGEIVSLKNGKKCEVGTGRKSTTRGLGRVASGTYIIICICY